MRMPAFIQRPVPAAYGVGLVLLLIVIAYFNIVFLGETLVSSANYHPFDDKTEHLRPRPVRSTSGMASAL